MINIIAFFNLIRFHNLLIACIAILISSYFLNAKINFEVIKVIIITIAFMSSGYICNDIVDIKTDQVNVKNRPLVKNILSINECRLYNIIFIIIGVFISLYINWFAQTILYFVIIPLLYLYNLYLKRFILVGNLVVAFLLSMVFVFLEVSLYETFSTMIIPAIFAFSLSIIREILKDLEDYKGDKFNQMNTLPIFLGKNKATWIVCALIVVFICFSISYGMINVSKNKYFLILLIILIEIPLLYSLFLLYKIPTKKTFYNLVKLHKIIAFNGLILLVFMKGI